MPRLRQSPRECPGDLQARAPRPRPRPARDPQAAPRSEALRVHLLAEPEVVPDPRILLPALRLDDRDRVSTARSSAGARHRARPRRAESSVEGPRRAAGSAREGLPSRQGRPRFRRTGVRAMKRVSVDIGGTFTDCFVAWDGRTVESKALTTHQNLALGFNEALANACRELGLTERQMLSQVDSVRYATTLGTNALIQRKGPRVGLLTTAGFRSSVPLARAKGYGVGLPHKRQMDVPNAQ